MATPTDSSERYSSSLTRKGDRFVSELFARVIENGWRGAEDFIDYFTVATIVESLANDDDLRVKLLVETTGTHEKIAMKKSISSAAEDLTLALDEGTTTADAILALFDADDWVRLLSANATWKFITGDEFWNAEKPDGGEYTEALERVTETIHCAVQHQLLSESDAVEAVGFERLAQGLDEAQLREVMVFALESGKQREPFTAAALLDVIPLEDVIEKVSLGRAWSEIVVRRVAEPLELATSGVIHASAPPAADAAAEAARKPPRAKAERPKRETKPKSARSGPRRAGGEPVPGPFPSREPAAPPPIPEAAAAPPERQPLTPPEIARRRSQPPPPASSSAPPPPRHSSAPPPHPHAHAAQNHAPPPPRHVQSAPPPRQAQSVPPPPPSARAAAARASAAPAPPPTGNDPLMVQAITRLSRIDRLPARHAEFPAVVLHAIETMYGELASVSDAQEQLNIIKDAFPNDLWRARAMLALLELLNPTLFATTPELAHESADALSVRLLSEERQLSRNAAQARATTQTQQRPGFR